MPNLTISHKRQPSCFSLKETPYIGNVLTSLHYNDLLFMEVTFDSHSLFMVGLYCVVLNTFTSHRICYFKFSSDLPYVDARCNINYSDTNYRFHHNRGDRYWLDLNAFLINTSLDHIYWLLWTDVKLLVFNPVPRDLEPSWFPFEQCNQDLIYTWHTRWM